MSVPCMQPLAVHVRVEELAAVRLERRTASPAVSGSWVRQPWITTCPPRLSTAAIRRLGADRVGQRVGEGEVDAADP